MVCIYTPEHDLITYVYPYLPRPTAPLWVETPYSPSTPPFTKLPDISCTLKQSPPSPCITSYMALREWGGKFLPNATPPPPTPVLPPAT